MALRFDLVIFDCDGVLIDSEIISASMLIEELALLGVRIDLDYVAKHFLGRSYPTVMQTIRQEFNLTLPPAFEDQYRARLVAAFESDLKIMPDVAGVIAGLGVPFCIATSSSPMRAAKSLDVVGLGKRAWDLFFHAANCMGAEPARCLVIEDSLPGIRAAKAAGMPVWRFTGGSHLDRKVLDEPEDARPDMRFASFAAFYDIAPDLKGQP